MSSIKVTDIFEAPDHAKADAAGGKVPCRECHATGTPGRPLKYDTDGFICRDCIEFHISHKHVMDLVERAGKPRRNNIKYFNAVTVLGNVAMNNLSKLPNWDDRHAYRKMSGIEKRHYIHTDMSMVVNHCLRGEFEANVMFQHRLGEYGPFSIRVEWKIKCDETGRKFGEDGEFGNDGHADIDCMVEISDDCGDMPEFIAEDIESIRKLPNVPVSRIRKFLEHGKPHNLGTLIVDDLDNKGRFKFLSEKSKKAVSDKGKAKKAA